MRIVEDDVECVVGCSAFAFGAHVRSEGEWRTEERQRLIDEVRTEIEKNAAARIGALAPRTGAQMWAESFEVRLEEHDSA